MLCSVLLTLGGYYCCSPCSFMTGRMDDREFLSRIEHTAKPKLYAMISSILTIVVLTANVFNVTFKMYINIHVFRIILYWLQTFEW